MIPKEELNFFEIRYINLDVLVVYIICDVMSRVFCKKLKYFEEQKMTLPYRLKELRQQKNLTQAKVADSLGITQQSYARWENGKVTPTPEKLSKIAKFYGVTTDYLLEGQKDDIDLSNVEVLFRMTSDGLTEEEKVIFRDELIEFMKERKKLFDEDKK